MRTISVNIYKFEELSDTAKDVARNWWRESANGNDWWDYIYEEAKNLGFKITSFDCDRGQSIDIALKTSIESIASKIREEHGENCDTHKAAVDYLSQLSKLNASSDSEENRECLEFLDSEFIRELKECYLRMLTKEYEYYFSDESVTESIECNDYEFTDKGEIV